MNWEDWKDAVTVTTTVVGAGIVAWVVAWIIATVGRRQDVGALIGVDRACRRPWVATVMAIALVTSLQDLDVWAGWRRIATIVAIGTACWLLVKGLLVLEQLIRIRLPTDVEDNRRVRRAVTQVTLIRRVAAAVVVLVGLAAALMTFPSMRTFGASLLASAGLAGIVAGLAAQTTLANVFAGIQLAFTDAIRVDDVVVVEGEWGRVEDITLTYVVIHIWDERRLVLPTSYFTTTPFQNWTRTQARVLGSVLLHVDYRTPLAELREEAQRVIEASPLWDRRDWVLQVTDTTETTMVIRVLASASDGPSAWDLRCDIREALLVWLRDNHPEALPTVREMSTGTLELVDDEDDDEAWRTVAASSPRAMRNHVHQHSNPDGSPKGALATGEQPVIPDPGEPPVP